MKLLVVGWRSIIVMGFAGLAGVLVTGISRAANWNENDLVYKVGTDSTVAFAQCNLAGNSHDAFHANNDHDIDPTDISPQLIHSCDPYEVRINDFGYGMDQPRGFYHCHELISAQVCGRAHAHVNTSYPDIPEQYGATLHIVCHEIGHTVGLGHSTQTTVVSCLKLGENGRHLTDHDKVHLDDNY